MPHAPANVGEPRRTRTQSIERALLLMRVLASSGRRGMRVADVCAASALAQSTVSRMLAALEREGMIERDTRTGRLFLGSVTHELGLVARAREYLPALSREAMRALAQRSQDTVYLSEPSGAEAVCTASEEGDFPVKALPLHVGIRRPLGVGAGGMAILAAMPAPRAEAIMRRNAARYPAYGGIELNELRRELARSRSRGWAAVAERATAGLTAVAVPIMGADGLPLGALSIAAITSRMPAERQAFLAGLLGEHCRTLSESAARDRTSR